MGSTVKLRKYDQNSPQKKILAIFFKIIVIVAVVAGIFFRCVHLGHQLYWHDEAYTLFRAAGFTGLEINQRLFDGQIHQFADVIQYQRLGLDTTWFNTIQSLAIEDAQHPPIYYLLVRIWMSLFDQSIATVRSLSALASLLMFPCLYWLSRLIFRSSLVGWMTVALFAVSPLQVMYAQEAREYALWSLTVLLSAIALLIAYERNNLISWTVYTVALIVSLYTFSLSLFLGISYTIWIFIRENYRLTKRVYNCLLTSLISLAFFIPWLIFAVRSWFATGNIWSSIPISWNSLFKTWVLHITRLLFLFSQNLHIDKVITFKTLLYYLILTFSFSITIYSFCVLIKLQPKSTWLLPIILTLSTFLPLAILDIIFGGQRTTANRYLMPTFLGIQVSLSFALINGLLAKNHFKRRIMQILSVFIIAVGIVSCYLNFQSPTAWTKVISYNLNQVAEISNQYSNSLIITSSEGKNFGDILALTYLLNEDTNFLLVDGWKKQDFTTEIKIPSQFTNIFALGISEKFRQNIQHKYKTNLQLVFSDEYLNFWQFSK